MQLEVLPHRLSVAKFKTIPQGVTGFFSLTDTGEEVSLVCETARLPQGSLSREDGWRAFRVAGVLDFSLVGVLAELSRVLAAKEIPLFVFSTYDTDYLLVKEENFEAATEALGQEHKILIRN